MNGLRIKRYLSRLYLGALLFFFLNKFALRPLILENDFPGWMNILVLSIPNTLETIFGMGFFGILLSLAREHFPSKLGAVPDIAIYLVSLALAGTFVLTQEFKLHNLGGNNVYDPNDVIASVIGLVVMFVLFVRFGILDNSESAK